jgi:short-subunit dehydrogenase
MDNSERPVILITGASSGIGESTARLFGLHNYRVVLAARRIHLLDQIAIEIQKDGGDVLPLETDVREIDDIETLVTRTIKEFGRIDVLFNNAGIGHMNWLEYLDISADIQMQLEVNLVSLIILTRKVLPYMIKNGSGHIINMSSISGYIGTPTYSIYAASKFGVRGFTEALRREVSASGIYVTGIYPGGVKSEFRQRMGFVRKTGITTPSWLLLEPDEIAQAVYKVTLHPHRTVILPKTMKFAILFNWLFPRWVDWIISKRFTIPERSG